MNSATFLKTLPYFPFTKLSKHNNPNPKHKLLKIGKQKKAKFSLTCNHNNSFDLTQNSTSLKLNNNTNNNNNKTNLSVPCFAAIDAPPVQTATTELAGDRLQLLVSEFKSLTEPIDRVKRLLDYAARLPPFDESARSPANRVTGCTTQVWLEAKIDEDGRMRFRADSDSEITKGFLSCLIWLLDGAEPEEVVSVKAEDLVAMNVGVYGKAQSRVNTWNNVLISMQERTKTLVVTADSTNGKGSFEEAWVEMHGILAAVQNLCPRVHVFDSLAMVDTAVKMAEARCQVYHGPGCKFYVKKVVHLMMDKCRVPEIDLGSRIENVEACRMYNKYGPLASGIEICVFVDRYTSLSSLHNAQIPWPLFFF